MFKDSAGLNGESGAVRCTASVSLAGGGHWEKKIECDDSDGSTTAMMMGEVEASEGRIEGASQTGEMVRNVRGKGTKKKRRGKEESQRRTWRARRLGDEGVIIFP